ncbi:MAG: PEP-CTERM sorting domain-containing protein [Phycisphaerae bacterium]|nr:PEP-CTERM sorting domain-containing protein [Phycisphaerae bacterium]
MHIIKSLVIVLAVVLAASVASADVFTFTPNPSDLNDLDHNYYYTWRISSSLIDQPISEATLTFRNIRNWDSNPNVLYIHLLDTAGSSPNVRSYWDGEGGGDAFLNQGIELVTYHNLPATGQTLTYSLDHSELVKLNEYLAAGRDFALGFDPDCHFYNDGISMRLVEGTFAPVPEPATLSLLAAGGAAMFFWRRRRNAR